MFHVLHISFLANVNVGKLCHTWSWIAPGSHPGLGTSCHVQARVPLQCRDPIAGTSKFGCPKMKDLMGFYGTMYICIYIYTYVYMYIYIYIHVHIFIPNTWGLLES